MSGWKKWIRKILPLTKIQELLIILLCRFTSWLIHFMDSSPVSYSLSSSNSYVSSRSTALSPPSSQHSLLHNSTGLDDNNNNDNEDDDTVTNIMLIQAELWQQKLQCPPPTHPPTQVRLMWCPSVLPPFPSLSLGGWYAAHRLEDNSRELVAVMYIVDLRWILINGNKVSNNGCKDKSVIFVSLSGGGGLYLNISNVSECLNQRMPGSIDGMDSHTEKTNSYVPVWNFKGL